MRRNWIIICGAIRDLDAFLPTLATACGLHAQGAVEGVILTTWNGEIDAHQGLRKRLAGLPVTVAETQDPGSNAWGNFARQLKHLRLALELCPDDAYVFKTRTDKSRLGELNLDLFKTDLTPDRERYPGFPDLFRERIVVQHCFPLGPLYISDMNYYGRKDDLETLISLCDPMRPRVSCMGTWAPEMRLFGTPFLSRFPILEAFYRRAHSPMSYSPGTTDKSANKVMTREQIDYSKQVIAFFLTHPFSRAALMTWWTILDRYFLLGLTRGETGPEAAGRHCEAVAAASIGDLFDPTLSSAFGVRSYGDPPNFYTRALSHHWLDGFVKETWPSDALFKRLHATFDEVRDYAFHQAFSDTLAFPSHRAESFADGLERLTGEREIFATVSGPDR
ncbi:hypothetical protein GM415_16890 [Pseudodesulfovibrio cashew]|uniref:Uncharacterized protein n=1 Tax=Pseudodesulfovibrio cashew TaxID=2678688 RepID=A0A6I6JL72_9BACT|nr:hypothetical protein [Pseudodesulfovibrio cashew]QGY41728.1 hypothetical protein GM415_16890 [Pseudodesulfovibrio cashew]